MSNELEKMVDEAFYKSFLEKFLNIFPCVDVRMPTEEEQDNEIYIQEIMKKEQPKRDNKCRFVKNEPKKAKKENKESYVYALSDAEYTQLVNERDAFKELAERMSSNYLNKCAEYGELKRKYDAYERYWKQMKRIAKLWRKEAIRRRGEQVVLRDDMRCMFVHMDWLFNHLSVWSRLFRKKQAHEIMDDVENIICHVEELTKE